MRPLLLTASLICLAATTGAAADASQGVPAKRAGAFLGVHFDLHALPTNKKLGEGVTPEHVRGFLDAVGPDYVQIDCKGHPGFASYPTRIGNAAGGFVGDGLAVWREATAARGVPLMMHYSGVIDGRVVKRRPLWAARNADGSLAARGRNRDGSPKTDATSVFGPYVRRVMIPQLRELAGRYDVDGVWVDGDCWGLRLDYSRRAVAAWRSETGLREAPAGPDDPEWERWREFNREGFRRYCREYVAGIKKTHPGFEVISNWAFGPHMPEPVSVGFDGLSGDYSSTDSVNSARYAGRCYENQGLPWDLMAWGFHRWSRKTKTPVQLKQEAAIVLALGGGFQCYFKQDDRLRIKNPGDVAVMAEVAAFCRERQPHCFGSEPVPQVGILYSGYAQYRTPGSLFKNGGPGKAAIERTLKALLADGYSVQILSEHHLAGRMSDWPVLVVPHWETLEPACRDELAAYAARGGKLVLAGDGPAAMFADEVGDDRHAIRAVPDDGGAVAAAVAELFPGPLVEIAGSDFVDVALRRLDGKLGVHLVNTSGPHADAPEDGIREIPPVGPLTVSVRLDQKPTAMTLQPGATPLEVDWDGEIATVVVPDVPIYSILCIE